MKSEKDKHPVLQLTLAWMQKGGGAEEVRGQGVGRGRGRGGEGAFAASCTSKRPLI